MPNLIGQSLGRYHILEQLGEGGMAIVYKAYDTRLEREVALKVVLPTRQHSQKFIKRFEREAKALARLSHPNIVKVLDFGKHEDLPFIVMEYISEGTLKKRLKGKPLPWAETAILLAPVARALDYAHQQGIIHRDVKPSNILITKTGQPMLTDFGVAKMMEADETLDLTGTGMGVGTPEYMAPEQFQGKNVDQRVDIYGLGVVYYEMVTGRKPFQADTPVAIIWKQATESLPRPSSFVPNLPKKIEQILLKALAKDPVNRYKKMADFGHALERLIQDEKNALKEQEETKKKIELQQKKNEERAIKKVEAKKNKAELQQQKREEKARKKQEAKKKKEEQQQQKREVITPKKRKEEKKEIELQQRKEEDQGKKSTRKKPEERSKKKEESSAPLKLVLWGIFGIIGLGLIYGVVNWAGALNMKQLSSTPILSNTSAPASKTSTSFPVASPTAKNTPTPEAASTPIPDLGSSWVRASDGMTMKYIPAGEFVMGAQSGNYGETPAHKVFLDAYWIDKFEITDELYKICVDADICEDNHPELYNNTVGFSWFGAEAYCQWVDGRLPTEAEWEKAARGGLADKQYPWGDILECVQQESPYWEGLKCGITNEGAKRLDDANGYGLNDMAGNHWEWVSDWYSPVYYNSSPDENPQGPISGKTKALRGGSSKITDIRVGTLADTLRVSYRGNNSPVTKNNNISFRCARDATP